MMGRTPSTSTTDLVTEDDSRLDSSDPDFCQQLGMLESARAFSIMRQTVIEIYTKQSVPLGLLQSISTKLQELSKEVPAELRSLEHDSSQSHLGCQHQRLVLRNASVACDYHFSMMLLTRPFLVACLRISFQNNRNPQSGEFTNSQDSNIHKDVARGAIQAIDAALSTVQLIYEIHVAGLLFNNMPLVV